MANKKISQLPLEAAPTGAAVIPIVQGGVTRRATLSSLPVSAADAAAHTALEEETQELGTAAAFVGEFLDINVREFAPTVDYDGGANSTAALNALAVAANALAVTRGRRVRLWGFAGAHLLVDGILSYERLRWEFEDAKVTKVAGVNPMFYSRVIPTAKTFSVTYATGRTVVDTNTIHDVEILRGTGRDVNPPGEVVVGAAITGAGIPAGATVTAIRPVSREVDISAPATATASHVAMEVNPTFGTLANGSPTVTNVTNPVAWLKGRGVSGTGIPGGTTILDIDWTNPNSPTVTLSANATASGATNITITGTTYFGNGRDIQLHGGVWDPNETAAMNGGVVWPTYVENFEIADATILHNWPDGFATWATSMLGYRGAVRRVQVLGGSRIFMDGPHLVGGEDWIYEGNYVESGDDCFPLVNQPDGAFALVDPRPIRNVVGRGNIGHSAEGHIFRPSVEPKAGGVTGSWGPHFAVTDVDFDASGSAGRYRNAAVGIFDVNAPAPANRLLDNITFRGKVKMGSRYHDGTNPYGVYVRGANRVTLDVDLDVVEGAAPIERYRVRETDLCELRLSGTGGTAPPLERVNRRFNLMERNRSARRRAVEAHDDMLALPTSPWQWLKGTDATANVSVVANVEGGVVKLTPGRANTGVAADGAQIDMLALQFKLTPNGSLRIEARVKVTFLTGIVAFIGFVDQVGSPATLTVPFQVVAAAITPHRNNAVGLIYDALATGSTFWGVGAKDGVAVGQNLGISPVGGVNAPWIDLAVEVDADGTAQFERDGERVGTPLANAVNIASLLTPCLRTSLRATGTGNFGELHVDRVDVRMVRAR